MSCWKPTAARPIPDDEPECADPELVTTEPLAVFLPARREDYRFRWVGRDREADREAIVLDYVPRNEEAPTVVTWDENCVSVDAPGMTRGRVWADASSGDVLRVDERLSGMFEFSVPFEHSRGSRPLHMALERAESSVRYRPVGFSDPAEVLLLPTSIEMMTIWRNTGVTRQLVTHDISNYRRFVTSSRILKSPHRR